MSGAHIPPLPPVRNGEKRAFRQCICGRVGWYDFAPYSASVPILAFPCGHDARSASPISEEQFFAATAMTSEVSLAEWIVRNWANQDMSHSAFRAEAFERAASSMLGDGADSATGAIA
ncbi:MAG: hypothetical protein J0H88_16335 [Sphingomonadales bacterium]|nr:hypothetical protein [Sphingomonadales bacterium]